MKTIGEWSVLDHGCVRVIEHWGSDESIIEAARMSTGKGFLGWGPPPCAPNCVVWKAEHSAPGAPIQYAFCTCGNAQKSGDEKLLRYLYEHKHHTPFEMAGMVIEVQAPIFVFREWHRHRTQSYNEMSARYVPLPNVNYTPTIARLTTISTGNKQAASTGNTLGTDQAHAWQVAYMRLMKEVQEFYELGLSMGVPKELARLPIPVARYSKMRASANLRNWLAFLTLRMDENAQWEIRQYANVVSNIVQSVWPRTHELFIEGISK